jgi:hypothetical protein
MRGTCGNGWAMRAPVNCAHRGPGPTTGFRRLPRALPWLSPSLPARSRASAFPARFTSAASLARKRAWVGTEKPGGGGSFPCRALAPMSASRLRRGAQGAAAASGLAGTASAIGATGATGKGSAAGSDGSEPGYPARSCQFRPEAAFWPQRDRCRSCRPASARTVWRRRHRPHCDQGSPRSDAGLPRGQRHPRKAPLQDRPRHRTALRQHPHCAGPPSSAPANL